MDIHLSGLNALSYNIDDYKKMFALNETELDKKILNYFSGVNAFAAEMAKLGKSVVACDPLYTKSLPEIISLIDKTSEEWLEEVKAHPKRYTISPEKAKEWLESRRKNAGLFFEDFDQGKKEGRYVGSKLPHLPFKENEFDLVLVSHYLFTYSDRLSVEFQVSVIQELMRVANEVRIFPLTKDSGDLSSHVGEVAAKLQEIGLGVELKVVPFELQKQGNALFRVWSLSCPVQAKV